MPDSEALFNILRIAAIFIGVSFLVFWVGLVWWVSQDILTRTSDKIIVAAAVAMTAILGPVGVMMYLIIRPKQTLKESYGEMMEHEMMLRAAATTICPMCEHMTQEDFVNCPYCGTVLKKQCKQCQKLVSMDWGYCPYCGTVADQHKPRTITSVEPTALKEVAQAKEAEAFKQNALQKVQLQKAQEAAFSTTASKNGQDKTRLSQAGQSALGLLKQAFASPGGSSTESLQSAEKPEQSSTSSKVDTASSTVKTADDSTSSESESKSSAAKKSPVKKRATKRKK